MKILYKTMGLGLLSACLCLLCAAPASAKVCFVGEENCTGGGSFEDYENPDADGSLCKQEGYTEKSLCQADMTKYIVAYCPYNSNYVMCCGREYSYDACVYPLVADGKCGNRFKCRCDSDKYPYKQQSATICQNTVTGQNYNNSIASGASCVYTGFANGQTSVNAYFTECLCDRGLYPKTEEECSTGGASVSEKACTDSNGNKYYASCICSDDFRKIASECEYGININEPMCQQADVIKVKQCCECNVNTYPYDDIKDVEGSNSPVASYASCEKEKGCTRGSRYRATSCKAGYKVVSGECVPKECDEALTDYFNERPIKEYALYETGKTPSATNVIITKDTGYGAKWENFYNKKVISAIVYANTLEGDDLLTQVIKTKCSQTPKIEISGITMSSTSPLDFTSVIIKSSSSWWNRGGFTCTNCGIDSGKFYNEAKAELKYDANMPNTGNVYAKYSGAEITAEYRATGYNHEFGSSGFQVRNFGKFPFMIEGVNNSNRIKVSGEGFSVKGQAAMRYANIYVKNLAIGVDWSYGNASTNLNFVSHQEYATSSSLSLYNSDYYLYDHSTGTANKLYMSTSTVLGVPGNTSNIIHMFQNNYHVISFAQLFYNCRDRYNTSETYRYLDASGNFANYQPGCHYYYSSTREKKGNRPDDIVCSMDGSGNRKRLRGDRTHDDCRWIDKGNDKPDHYFKYDGQRGF